MSRHQSQPLSPDVVRLKELVAAFPSSRPFDQLEVIATLGVGGFGRVELVRHLGRSRLQRGGPTGGPERNWLSRVSPPTHLSTRR